LFGDSGLFSSGLIKSGGLISPSLFGSCLYLPQLFGDSGLIPPGLLGDGLCLPQLSGRDGMLSLKDFLLKSLIFLLRLSKGLDPSNEADQIG
jgi:hypothetical protein